MSRVLLRKLDNRFEADVVSAALKAAGVPHLLRTYEDTAYDGLYISQKGFGDVYVDPEHQARAEEVLNDLEQAGPALPASIPELAARLDHTLLRPEATVADLERHMDECMEMEVAAACISPWMVERAADALADSPVAVCGVVGFPLGTQSEEAKAAEARELSRSGAHELDMVLNRGLVLSGRIEEALAEVTEVAEAAPEAIIKVILEMNQLPEQLIPTLAEGCRDAGADFLKTGSGFFGPATVDQVKVLKRSAGMDLAVKAAGGIRTLDEAMALIAAGAERLGTSSGMDILRQARERWE
jgi:deoxyribose-phosphate aldolase